MTNSLHPAKRLGAALFTVLLLCALVFRADAAAPLKVGVGFWKENSSKSALINDGVDMDRQATLIRQTNGTFTLELPIRQFSVLQVSGSMTGITIGDITYSGTVTGDPANGTGILTIENLPASVLTGSDPNKALLVTCTLQTNSALLGEVSQVARMCIWVQ